MAPALSPAGNDLPDSRCDLIAYERRAIPHQEVAPCAKHENASDRPDPAHRTGLIGVTASRRFAAQAAEEARQRLERMASERLQARTAVDGLFKAKVVDNSTDLIASGPRAVPVRSEPQRRGSIVALFASAMLAL